MANPQVENGYTQIANEVLENLVRTHLSPNEWQVLLCIIRKTYGFHKKVDYIANCQLVEATGLCKAVVSRVVHGLEDRRMLTRDGKQVGFQKDWEQWQELAISSTKVSSIANNEAQEVSSLVNTEKLAEPSTPEPTPPEKLAEQLTNEKLAISSQELAVSSTKVSSPRVTQKIKDTLQKIPTKYIYGEFSNVLLTDGEHQKLIGRFGEDGAKERIEILSTGMATKPKKYKYDDHYAAVLSWARRDERLQKEGISGKAARDISKDPFAGWREIAGQPEDSGSISEGEGPGAGTMSVDS